MELIPEFNYSCQEDMDFPIKLTLTETTIKSLLSYVKKNNVNQIINIIFSNMPKLNEIFCLLNSSIFFDIFSSNITFDISKTYIEKLSNLYFYNYIAQNDRIIILNNKYNRYYNFDNVLEKVNNLKNIIKQYIDCENYHLGTNATNYLFGNYKKTGSQNIDIYLMEKITILKGKVCHVKNLPYKVFMIKDDQFTLVIHNIYNEKNNIKNIMNYYDNKFVIADNNIYFNPKYLSTINDPPTPIIYEPIELPFDIKKIQISYRNTNKLIFKKCYCCNKNRDLIYYEYDSMCIKCGMFNKIKRDMMADLTGQNIFISGIRQKIGFCAAYKLLKCGATIYGTTRYVAATLANFMAKPDYEEFKSRLNIIKCDFLNFDDVNNMILELKTIKLNAIINNACQTTMPSSQYLSDLHTLESTLAKQLTNEERYPYVKPICMGNTHTESRTLTLPNIVMNEFGDVKDFSLENSWTKKIEDISPMEIISANMINLVVPTLIINQLKPLLVGPKFIINVTAIEGNFKSKKNNYHAHTNSYKAGLNMLTKTIAMEMAEDPELWAYCIDPGFVSGVLKLDNYYPIKMEDGGARIIDPIIMYHNKLTMSRENNINLKNYKPFAW